MKRSGKKHRRLIIALMLILIAAVICLALKLKFGILSISPDDQVTNPLAGESFSRGTCLTDPEAIPEFSGADYIELNGNQPNFTEYDIKHIHGEYYSELDKLERCGSAVAMLDQTMMPAEDRGSIGRIKPSGWHTVKYPELIVDNYLYNRCHLIAYAMTGQNDNEKNLITGTRYLNVSGMLPFEKKVLHELDRSDQQILYRVTPFFKDKELVARGVEMEAYSVEDHGKSVCFHVFVYNQQPGVTIDYQNGESHA